MIFPVRQCLTSLFAMALLLVGFSSDALANRFGSWFSGFDAKIGSLQLEINLDQLGADKTGAAALSFFPKGSLGSCPAAVHPGFCDELDARALRGDYRAFDNEIVGVLYEGNKEAFVAFRFQDEAIVRLVAIQRQGGGQAALRIYHPTRGIDLEQGLTSKQHVCAISNCNNDRLKIVMRDKNAALGVFQSGTFFRLYDPRKDLRANAHAAQKRQGSPSHGANRSQKNGFGIYQSVGQYLTAIWQVRGNRGQTLGELRIFATGTPRMGGFGELYIGSLSGKAISVAMDEHGRNAQLVNFSISHEGGAKSGRPYGRLRLMMPTAPSGKVQAFLTHKGQEMPLTLIRVGAYEGEVEDAGDAHGQNSAGNAGVHGGGDGHGSAASDIVDLTFHLRNVPQGRSLIIRQGPNRATKAIGSLSRSAGGLHVLRCTPNIDAEQFERANHGAKLRLLNRVWCQIDSDANRTPRGYILGRYLEMSR